MALDTSFLLIVGVIFIAMLLLVAVFLFAFLRILKAMKPQTTQQPTLPPGSPKASLESAISPATQPINGPSPTAQRQQNAYLGNPMPLRKLDITITSPHPRPPLVPITQLNHRSYYLPKENGD
jgi:hypothetical protein